MDPLMYSLINLYFMSGTVLYFVLFQELKCFVIMQQAYKLKSWWGHMEPELSLW